MPNYLFSNPNAQLSFLNLNAQRQISFLKRPTIFSQPQRPTIFSQCSIRRVSHCLSSPQSALLGRDPMSHALTHVRACSRVRRIRERFARATTSPSAAICHHPSNLREPCAEHNRTCDGCSIRRQHLSVPPSATGPTYHGYGFRRTIFVRAQGCFANKCLSLAVQVVLHLRRIHHALANNFPMRNKTKVDS